LAEIPPELADYGLELAKEHTELVYTYDTQSERTGITALLGALNGVGIKFKDLNTTQSSLEDIFVSLVKRKT
jgi:ABC-2 type transport system ATP-binding protein